MKGLYLVLAVLGTVGPWVFFAGHVDVAGPNPLALVAAGYANAGAAGLTTDLLISSLVFWVFLFANGEARRAAWLIPVNLLVGLSCALPLYLYLRARSPARAASAIPGSASAQVG